MDTSLKIMEKEIQLLGLHTFFYFEHTKDFFTRGEKHDFWEFVYVDSGEVDVVSDNVGYRIQQGEVIFHKPMEFHALAANKKDPHNVLVFTFSSQSKGMNFFKNKIFMLNRQQKKVLSRALEEARMVFSEGKELSIGAGQLLIGYLEEFLILLLRSAKGNDNRHSRKNHYAKFNVESALTENIEKYLAEHIYHRITLSDVCQNFNMSSSYICLLFKESTGKTVMDYYLQLKIAEAKKLIRRGELNFTQISEQLGYTSIHHFSRSFKTISGESPSSYERSIKLR